MTTVLKRNYTRSRNELGGLEAVLSQIGDVEDEYTEETAESFRLVVGRSKARLEAYSQRRDLLEAAIEDEAQLEVLVPQQSEELYEKLSQWILNLERKLVEYDCRKRRERAERETEKEVREMEERNEREVREHRVRMEELDLRRLEIEKMGNNNSSCSSGHTHLPKVELVKFNGELEKYQEFSDNFMTLIDSRTDLADNMKLHYLKGQLVGKAGSLIEGLRITNDNYKVAMDILREEYGTPEVIHHKIYSEIEKLKLYSRNIEHIQEFYRKLEVNLKLLENQGVDVNTNPLLSSLLFRKLPEKTQEKLVEEKGSVITVYDIREQIKAEMRRDRMLRSLNPEVKSYERTNISKSMVPVQKPPPRTRYTTENLVSIDKSPVARTEKGQCIYCNEGHFADQCPKYKTVEERREQLGTRCYICLLPGHSAKQCRSEYRCWHCSRYKAHHRSLCPSIFSSSWRSSSDSYSSNRSPRYNITGPSSPHPSTSSKPVDSEIPVQKDKGTVLSAVSCALGTVVYMQTALLRVHDKKTGRVIPVRAILDSASSHSYMSEKLSKLLDLKSGQAVPMNVFTFGALEPKKMTASEVTIEIFAEEKPYQLNLFVVPNIVCSSNPRSYHTEFLSQINEWYTLADEFLLEKPAQEFDILIGVDYYARFVLGERIQIDNNLFLLNTICGYVLSGSKSGRDVVELEPDQSIARSVLFTRTEISIDPSKDIKKLWDLLTIGIKENHCVSDDDLALQSFEAGLQYEDSRYSVDFPWKNESREVQSNYGLAFGRLKSLLARHKKDGILEACEKTITSQLESGILEKVAEEDLGKKSCYFPYHAVIKEDSATTKVRFVMDASARQNRSKPSLNDLLYRGPVLLENLCSLLLRFRMYRCALIGDIEKAFLNVGLNEGERDYTRILWVKDVAKPLDSDNVVVLRHTRLPFGVVSSPFLLSCVIRTHLDKYSGDYIDQLKNNIYMDNILCGVNNEEEIENFVGTARKVFSDASLNLREWASNYPSVLIGTLSPELVNTSRVQNTLGMLWDTQKDTLSLKFHYEYKQGIICKRLLLSVLASFFDILGLWTPIIMSLKLLVQSAWIQKKEWDDELDSKDKEKFLEIVDSMNFVSNIPVARYFDVHKNHDDQSVRYELHAFSDACSYSYASVVYLRSVSHSGDIKTNIVFAKSRVAPTNKPTLPRLELLGALIAYRSLKFVKNSLHINIDKCYLWIDNQCVIHWLTGNKVLPTFVNNRVKEIKASVFPIVYKYIPTDSNPADLACRGSSAVDLQGNKLWWEGPGFLALETWPDFPFQCKSICEEVTVDNGHDEVNLVSKCEEKLQPISPLNIDEQRYSSFKKLVNVTCYVKKFVNLCRKRSEFKGPISLEEFSGSKTEWLKYAQEKYFPSTVEKLKQGLSDPIATQLGLELNDEGLLICKGRFRELRYDAERCILIQFC
ncbi:hypothetical protein M8J77_000061 [Diaphorina citri]|nr:hypothetical protein M8J77_000061 [Diaphorina citri]